MKRVPLGWPEPLEVVHLGFGYNISTPFPPVSASFLLEMPPRYYNLSQTMLRVSPGRNIRVVHDFQEGRPRKRGVLHEASWDDAASTTRLPAMEVLSAPGLRVFFPQSLVRGAGVQYPPKKRGEGAALSDGANSTQVA